MCFQFIGQKKSKRYGVLTAHISFPCAFILCHFKSKAGGCWMRHMDQSVETLITGKICQLRSLTQLNAFLN